MYRKPMQTIHELYEAFARRDLSKVFSLLSSDIEIVQSEELPWGAYTGAMMGPGSFSPSWARTLIPPWI
jgi:ketosteroid isomerase-like protein